MADRSGRTCTICNHPQTAEISKAIANRGSKRTIADRFGVSGSAVMRHKANCLAITPRAQSSRPSLAPIPAAQMDRFEDKASIVAADPKSLLRRAELLLDDAQAILTQVKATGDVKTALVAVRETRASIQLLMDAHGMLGKDGITVNIDARKQSLALLDGKSFDDLLAMERALDRVNDNRTLSSPTTGGD